jgi:hypothetical protein
MSDYWSDSAETIAQRERDHHSAFSIATVADSGYAKVRAGIKKTWDGKTWTAWGPYSATKTWKFK